MSIPTTPPQTMLPLPQSTPFKTGGPSALLYTTTQKFRVPSCTALADEIAPYLVGPMPAQQFLDDFFPLDDIPGLDSIHSFTRGCYCSTVEAKNETAAYEPFINTTKKFIPGLQIVNSSNSPDRKLGFSFAIKPDISIYRSDLPIANITDSSLAEIFIEFKWQSPNDPFCDVTDHLKLPKSFLRQSNAARDTLGQITSYAAAQLGSQFRTHIYSVFIVKNFARLLRWDRSGTIVTEAIEYNESSLLVDFFRRYSKASPEMCGKDQSVSAVMPTEADEARQALKLDNGVPLLKLAVPVTEQLSRYFITHPPRAALYTPPGRATRGFRAYDISEQKVVFLKDSWRIDLKDIHMEGSIYEVLRRHEVPHVPRCLISGDILTDKYHATKANGYSNSPWACHSDVAHFIPHRHYRLVLDIVGDPLMNFHSSYEMVSAIRDALHAHEDAWNAGILHRDISPGNIIIGPDRRGWLIDWDLSKPIQENERETPRRATRTGTWQFMSASLVSGNQTQDYRDDLESSLYTLLWVAVMYLKCPDPPRVSALLNNIFEPHPGIKVTDAKADFLKGRSFLAKKRFPRPRVLLRLVTNLAKLFATRYPDDKDGPSDTETEDGNSSPSTTTSVSVSEYDESSSLLNNHSAVISLFDAALQDRSKWPDHDKAAIQQYHTSKKAANEPELKTDWITALLTSEDVEMKDAQN